MLFNSFPLSIKMFLIFPMLFFSVTTWSQKSTVVKGKITDENGEGLIGASVYVEIEKKMLVGTVSDIDGNYEINVPDCSKTVLVFSYVGMGKQRVAVNCRTSIDVQMQNEYELNEDINYYYNRSIVLNGSLNYAHYGLGWYFVRHGLWNTWLHLPTNIFYDGEVSYHTDFQDNQEIHVNIKESDAGRRNFRFNAAFDRYDIPDLAMDMNKYYIGSSIFLHNDTWNIRPGFEYLDWRTGDIKDEYSVMASLVYYNRKIPITPEVTTGISFSGKPMFIAGMVFGRYKWPVNVNLSAGYWMDDFKCKAEVSRSFKRFDIALRYERFLNYENAYLTLRIPYQKCYAGVGYQNLLE